MMTWLPRVWGNTTTCEAFELLHGTLILNHWGCNIFEPIRLQTWMLVCRDHDLETDHEIQAWDPESGTHAPLGQQYLSWSTHLMSQLWEDLGNWRKAQALTWGVRELQASATSMRVLDQEVKASFSWHCACKLQIVCHQFGDSQIKRWHSAALQTLFLEGIPKRIKGFGDVQFCACKFLTCLRIFSSPIAEET